MTLEAFGAGPRVGERPGDCFNAPSGSDGQPRRFCNVSCEALSVMLVELGTPLVAIVNVAPVEPADTVTLHGTGRDEWVQFLDATLNGYHFVWNSLIASSGDRLR